MGWIVTLVRVGLAIWRATNGFKSYTGATLIAVASVGYYATCPKVVGADGLALPAWMTPDLWVMVLGFGASLAVAGLKSALTQLKNGLTPEAFAILVDIVRKALEPYETPKTPDPVPDVFPQARSTEDDSGIVDLPTVAKSLLVLCCLAGSASAAAPKAIINGPVTGTAGELLTLDASGSQGENVKYLWRIVIPAGSYGLPVEEMSIVLRQLQAPQTQTAGVPLPQEGPMQLPPGFHVFMPKLMPTPTR